MSMNPATFYRWAVFRPFAAFRQRAEGGWERAPAAGADSHAAPCRDPERLERIAVYARAGYFNMGYTLDMFHVIGEIAPE
ncbi:MULTISPECIES: hypothetical protein [Paraburkholderia]|jgi:hypothetical protein|uniref:Uncharacterized protein n=1 Tax=Paraburkholderia caledonica TaxID=134536 RepID=A0AB73IN23_9BURK|nr:hypothetical protein [Paraburkholderia strydomiana]MDP9651384.1 hypothetical protein [Paraburkholderia caledonica]MDR7009788.1 hypothetical protein [Paraburkholderia strydomiana]